MSHTFVRRSDPVGPGRGITLTDSNVSGDVNFNKRASTESLKTQAEKQAALSSQNGVPPTPEVAAQQVVNLPLTSSQLSQRLAAATKS